MTVFSCRLVTTPTFRRRFSSVLSKFSHTFFHSGVIPLDGVTRGGPPLTYPSDATGIVSYECVVFVLKRDQTRFQRTSPVE